MEPSAAPRRRRPDGAEAGPAGREPRADLERLEPGGAAGAHLVVFPECALSGYGFSQSRRGARPRRPDRRARRCGRSSRPAQRHRCYCIFGLLERDGSRLFNACVLTGPDGVVGTYRKVHLPFLGIDMFVDPGDRPFAVHDAGGLKVGMHICYDGAFPETGPRPVAAWAPISWCCRPTGRRTRNAPPST